MLQFLRTSNKGSSYIIDNIPVFYALFANFYMSLEAEKNSLFSNVVFKPNV